MRRAYLLTAVVILGWSVGPVGVKALLRSEGPGPAPDPLLVSFWPMVAAWVVMAGALALRGRLARLGEFPGRAWAVLGAMGFFGWAGYAVALNYALQQLPLASAVIINYLHPVFTVLFQGPAFARVARALSGSSASEEPVSRPPVVRLAAGMALALAGVAYIATDGQLGRVWSLADGVGGAGGRPAAGALSALFAAFAWGVYSNLGRFVQGRSGPGGQAAAELQTFAGMTFGVAMLAAALGVQGMLRAPAGLRTDLYFLHWGPASVSAWAVAVGMGVTVHVVGFTLWLAALEAARQAGHPHRVPPLTYLTPVLAVANGWVFLHEPVGRAFWWGGLLIALGNGLIAVRRRAPASGALASG